MDLFFLKLGLNGDLILSEMGTKWGPSAAEIGTTWGPQKHIFDKMPSPFQALAKKTFFFSGGVSLGPHLVPISAAEGPHLVPISLKIGSPVGPHFEKFRSPFHVGAVGPTLGSF